MSPAVYSNPLFGAELAPPFPREPCMSNRLYFSRATLAVASTLVIAACSSDAPTSPTMVSQNQTVAAVAPAIAIQASPLLRNLCYPARSYSVRGCPSGASVHQQLWRWDT